MNSDAEILNRFLSDELPSGCVGAVRCIEAGDENLLTAAEAEPLQGAVLPVRRASGAGRYLARRLCEQIGVAVTDIPRAPERYPLWPAGVLGSIAHDAELAAAAVANAGRLGGLGIDVEPASDLSSGVWAMLGSEEERAPFANIPYGAKALFSIKEAVFKAVYPCDKVFLDFFEVTVRMDRRNATTRYGRTAQWRLITKPHVLVIAWW